MVSDFKRPMTVKTVQDQEVMVDGLMWYFSKYLKVNNDKTVKTEIKATNRVIHAIDTVLMPK